MVYDARITDDNRGPSRPRGREGRSRPQVALAAPTTPPPQRGRRLTAVSPSMRADATRIFCACRRVTSPLPRAGLRIARAARRPARCATSASRVRRPPPCARVFARSLSRPLHMRLLLHSLAGNHPLSPQQRSRARLPPCSSRELIVPAPMDDALRFVFAVPRLDRRYRRDAVVRHGHRAPPDDPCPTSERRPGDFIREVLSRCALAHESLSLFHPPSLRAAPDRGARRSGRPGPDPSRRT